MKLTHVQNKQGLLFAHRPCSLLERDSRENKAAEKNNYLRRKKVATNNEDATLLVWRRPSCGCRWPSSCTLGCSSPAEQAGCSSRPLLAAQLYGRCHYWVGGWRPSPRHRSHCTCCGSSSAQREQTGGREVALPTTAQAQPGRLVLHHLTLFLEGGGCLLTPLWVHRYAWGEEAFAKAKRENKPIFLSIGYSTCQ